MDGEKEPKGRVPIFLNHMDEEDRKKIDSMVQSNMGLVYSTAYNFFRGAKFCRRATYTLEDAISDGTMALMHAAARFNPNFVKNGSSIKFSTYATWWIRSWIQRGYMQSRLIYDKRATARGSYDYSLKFESLWHPDDSGDTIDIPDDVDSVLEMMEHTEKHIENRDMVQKLLRYLPDKRDRHIISLRYLKDRTLREIGERLGLSRERVRQLEGRAMARLREMSNLHEVREQING